MSRELNEALERVLKGIGSDGDCILLKKAFTNGDITVASGDHSVSIKSNTNSPVITGNNCIFLNIDGLGDQQEIIKKLSYFLDRIDLLSKLRLSNNNLPDVKHSKTQFITSHLNNYNNTHYYILAHFLDHYVQEINGCKNKKTKIFLKKQAKQVLNISLICSEKVLLPAVSYAQSQMTRSILQEYELAIQAGLIELIGDGITWNHFCKIRQQEYSPSNSEYKVYHNLSKSFSLIPSFSSIEGSITEFIQSSWSEKWNKNQDTFKIFRARDQLNLQERFEEKVFRAANDLEGVAFISRNIENRIFSNVGDLEKSLLIDDICSIFFDYFLQDRETIFLAHIPYFLGGEPRNSSKKVDFSRLINLLSERCDISIAELLNISWHEGLKKFGAIGKYCIQEILQNTRAHNGITNIDE